MQFPACEPGRKSTGLLLLFAWKSSVSLAIIEFKEEFKGIAPALKPAFLTIGSALKSRRKADFFNFAAWNVKL